MKIFLILIVLLNLLDAKMNFYSLNTSSEFTMELPSKTLKKIELNSRYAIGVNSDVYNFDFNGLIFKNKDIKINIANLKVYAAKSEKLYKVRIQKYLATTKVNLNNKYIGEFQWSNINELNKGLTKLTKSYNTNK
ncbi:MAG: hypothetical protein HRT43_06185 [Campylobacteraceae bacterium]|nr:hypothetical protein [Campylobacteraceae bacterium]